MQWSTGAVVSVLAHISSICRDSSARSMSTQRHPKLLAHNLHHKSYDDASYRSTTNSSVALRMQVMGKVMDFTVSRLLIR